MEGVCPAEELSRALKSITPEVEEAVWRTCRDHLLSHQFSGGHARFHRRPRQGRHGAIQDAEYSGADQKIP
ncbi:hypothetical protein NDU88_001232 [Pleurodeles waltl]|uniref:Uncharacterized protein n=1 Tax=Pleurodeles waltl TaxID=8319 RepID=A0AAV7LY07_PLEWA|nr:hypothetical protein NDU88_001232 [Pleurodeles waltl]